jgi:sigma-54 dependent transcriptional regulator, acetoin dehydrogenase operon transcriptional activator AcoR
MDRRDPPETTGSRPEPRGARFNPRKARMLFLEGEPVPREEVRAPILSSWQRSRYAGVDADRIASPYDPGLDPHCKLATAAGPVLDRLADTLDDTPMSLILTDAKSRVQQRRTGDRALNDHLDRICLAPGFSYAEEFVGTNGIGTAIEDGHPAQVFGAEHFSEDLQLVCCAAAPIRNPTTGRIVGLIDLTSWRQTASPLMAALVREAASDIEQRLLELGSARERALLHEFMTSRHRLDRALVTVGDGFFMADAAAADLLTPADHRILRERAPNIADGEELLILGDGRTVRARGRAVELPGLPAPVGYVIELATVADRVAPARPAPSHRPGWPAWSAAAPPGTAWSTG